MNLTDLIALLSSEPVGIRWDRNAATGAVDWAIQVATCAEFGPNSQRSLPTPQKVRAQRRQLLGVGPLATATTPLTTAQSPHICHGCEVEA